MSKWDPSSQETLDSRTRSMWEMNKECFKARTSRARLRTRILPMAVLMALPVAAQTTQELRMTVGKSVVVDYPADVGRISTSNPEVVDYVAVTTREILLHAKAHGTATLIVWAKSGQREFYTVTVEHNLEPIRKLLKETFPTEEIKVQAARDTVSLTGRVANKDVSDRVALLVSPLVKTVVNNLQLMPPKVEKQIMLRVKFAEIDRNISSDFALNLISSGAGNTIARTTTGAQPAPGTTDISRNAKFSLSDALNVFAFRPDLNIGAVLKALQARGNLQILAEPNLVTTNGKDASFLVGGEFPVPVLQGGSNAGAVTIQFREFGIRLTFNPLLTENKTIKMYVKPEVSTIDVAHGVTVSGFTIPALATRRMETNVELGEGQSFVIAGLLDNRVTENLAKIPGLANIPLLGAIFKSKSETKSNTELVVMVTPELTSPTESVEKTPMPEFPRPFLGPTQDSNLSDKKTAKEESASKPAKKGSVKAAKGGKS